MELQDLKPGTCALIHLKDGIYDFSGAWKTGIVGHVTLVPRKSIGLEKSSGHESYVVSVADAQGQVKHIVPGCNVRAASIIYGPIGVSGQYWDFR